MTMHFSAIAEKALADGTICAKDVLDLRRTGWADGTITAEEAATIFAVNRRLATPEPEWAEFFREAITHFIVEIEEPRGYVSEANARWLIDQIEADGAVCSLTELETLIRVFETALSTPETLRVWAIECLEREVLTGEGPTRCGGELEKGRVTQAEAALLRRVLFSSGSDRPAGIGRREAELLFRLKDETLSADNAPEWKALFVQGVGNYLQGFTSHTPLDTERAAELERFMNDTSSSVGRFLGRTGRAALNPNHLGKVFGKKPPRREFNALVEAATDITRDEQIWLDERIEANGMVDEYDQALLRFLAEG